MTADLFEIMCKLAFAEMLGNEPPSHIVGMIHSIVLPLNTDGHKLSMITGSVLIEAERRVTEWKAAL